MSRIGKIPVSIPKEVKISLNGSSISVEGPKGSLSIDVASGIKVEQQEDALVITRENDIKQNRANHGTTRALLANMVVGVTQGHKKELEIQGVGFRAKLQGKKLSINLGFSHPVEYDVPDCVDLAVPNQTTITIEGKDKESVGLVAAQIRGLKPPEPYKGKGIRYVGENVRRKQGKTVTK